MSGSARRARLVDERARVRDDPALAARVLEDRVQDPERVECRLRRAAGACHPRHEALDRAAVDLVSVRSPKYAESWTVIAERVGLERRALAALRAQRLDEQLAGLGDRDSLAADRRRRRPSGGAARARPARAVRPSRVDGTRFGPIRRLTCVVPAHHLPYHVSRPAPSRLTKSDPVPRGRRFTGPELPPPTDAQGTNGVPN